MKWFVYYQSSWVVKPSIFAHFSKFSMYAWGKKGKMLVFTGVYVCVMAKLTFVSFFSFFFLAPSPNILLKIRFSHVISCHQWKVGHHHHQHHHVSINIRYVLIVQVYIILIKYRLRKAVFARTS